ncbi:M48 metallopeptidase family protein [Candidatus Pyrohabitans sp.]
MDFSVRVIRSPRRKKTVEAKLRGRELLVYMPASISESEEKRWVEFFVERMKRRLGTEQDDEYLRRKFEAMNRRYFGGSLRVERIEFSKRMNSRFGSCNPGRRTIRLSDRLRGMPEWVLDYVLIHEMTHLLHPNHSKVFWRKVNEYKYAERARGFLICKSMEEDEVEE